MKYTQLQVDAHDLQTELVTAGWEIQPKKQGNFDATKDHAAVEIRISSGTDFEVDLYTNNELWASFAEPYYEEVFQRIYDELDHAPKAGRSS